VRSEAGGGEGRRERRRDKKRERETGRAKEKEREIERESEGREGGVGRERGRQRELVRERDIDSVAQVMQGLAKLVDGHTVEIGDRRVTADKILIAVGGWPVRA
jgi:pyruvate/2-oxoglutarate dehydrogenase complex dihydrolipoamide dehydrogenase (E3) component